VRTYEEVLGTLRDDLKRPSGLMPRFGPIVMFEGRRRVRQSEWKGIVVRVRLPQERAWVGLGLLPYSHHCTPTLLSLRDMGVQKPEKRHFSRKRSFDTSRSVGIPAIQV